MNKSVAEKWVKALRSGQYKQGYNRLGNAAECSFCCLGVLCELAANEGIVERHVMGASVLYDEAADGLPASVQKWADMVSCVGHVEARDDFENTFDLVTLNDEEGMTFDAIASFIEENVDRL